MDKSKVSDKLRAGIERGVRDYGFRVTSCGGVYQSDSIAMQNKWCADMMRKFGDNEAKARQGA